MQLRATRLTAIASAVKRAFNIRSLFAGSVQGVWYDPSDYTTLFQDSAGTTPVTAVEQPVGLMLDKSQGLVLGPELVTNGDFSVDLSGWTQLNAVAGVKYFEWDASGGARMVTDGSTPAVGLAQTILTLGKTYKVTFDIVSISGALQVGSGASIEGTYTTVGTKTVYIVNAINTNFRFFRAGSAANVVIDNISVKQLAGNHAFQATSASRPVLSARYNLLTKTEDFSDAVWVKTGSSTATATKISAAASVSVSFLQALQSQPKTATSISFVASVEVKEAELRYCGVAVQDAGSLNGVFTQTDTRDASQIGQGVFGTGFTLTSVTRTLLPDGYVRIVVVASSNLAVTIAMAVQPSKNSTFSSTPYTAGEGMFVRNASLVPANQSTLPYQRVNTATDYATTGFLPYLKFDGVDDSLSTNSISFTATDKMSVFAGVRKLSEVGAIIAELSVASATNNGSFTIFNSPFNTPGYGWQSSGTIRASAEATSGYVVPITNTLTGLGDISGDRAALRINGTQVAQSTADQGTGNYGNYPLYIGRRGGSSLPFNGQLYSMIIVGKAVTAGELSSTEKFVASKTGVTL